MLLGGLEGHGIGGLEGNEIGGSEVYGIGGQVGIVLWGQEGTKVVTRCRVAQGSYCGLSKCSGTALHQPSILVRPTSTLDGSKRRRASGNECTTLRTKAQNLPELF